MKSLGRVINRAHNGLFVVVCDATAQFGGWDDYGEQLADDGSQALDLGGLRAYVEEGDGRYGGEVRLYQGDNGMLWLAPPREPGVEILAADRIESEPRTDVFELGMVDVPSGMLTIALAYPALNLEATGDHAGLVHEAEERLDVSVPAGAWALTRERTAVGQIIALRPIPN